MLCACKFCKLNFAWAISAGHTRLSFPRSKSSCSSRILEIIQWWWCMANVGTGLKRLGILRDIQTIIPVHVLHSVKKSCSGEIGRMYGNRGAQHRSKISKVSADNGGEYTSTGFKCFSSVDIHVVCTMPYNSKVNGDFGTRQFWPQITLKNFLLLVHWMSVLKANHRRRFGSEISQMSWTFRVTNNENWTRNL